MVLVSSQNLNLAFGSNPLLKDVDFSISKGQKIALIGKNGAGKSTLLKLLSKKISQDSGNISFSNNVIVRSLVQEVPNFNGTIFEVMLKNLEEKGSILLDYLNCLEQDLTIDKNMDNLQDLQQKMDLFNLWGIEDKVNEILNNFNFEKDASFNSLSGGQKRKVFLASCLIEDTDLLLLDEPTNHLDVNSILWLEKFLQEFKGAILLITHDRFFLDNVTDHIMEIDRGKIVTFKGNYSKYLEKKEHLLKVEEEQRHLFNKRLKQEEVWIRQGIKARRTRNEGRVRSLKKMREEKREQILYTKKAKFSANEVKYSGKIVIEAKNISFKYDDEYLFKHFSTIIQRGDKVAILGANGCGKSTLLKVLLKKITSKELNINHGTNLEISYFDQMRNTLQENLTLRENIVEGNDFIDLENGKKVHIVSYLQKFLFTSDKINAKVSALSGGERNRLLLAKLLSKPSNLLVLDEPTNDLDIETLEVLEDLLVEYKGTILLVSHDRKFIDNIATSTIVFEKNSFNLEEYVGGYSDYLSQKSNKDKNKKEKSNKKITKVVKDLNPVKNKIVSQNQEENSIKLNFNERRRLNNLPNLIEKQEKKVNEIYKLMEQEDFYTKSQKEVLKVQKKLNFIKKELDNLYKEWEELSEKE